MKVYQVRLFNPMNYKEVKADEYISFMAKSLRGAKMKASRDHWGFDIEVMDNNTGELLSRKSHHLDWWHDSE